VAVTCPFAERGLSRLGNEARTLVVEGNSSGLYGYGILRCERAHKTH